MSHQGNQKEQSPAAPAALVERLRDAMTRLQLEARPSDARREAVAAMVAAVDALASASPAECASCAELRHERDKWMASSAGYGSDAVEWKIRAEAAEASLQTQTREIETLQEALQRLANLDPDDKGEHCWCGVSVGIGNHHADHCLNAKAALKGQQP